MPASDETISNRPLSGHELKQIIEKDVATMLSKDGLFAAHIGYGRVAYRVTVEMQMDNLTYPKHTARVISQDPARREKNEARLAIHKPPLKDPATDAATVGMARDRVIDSPNLARLEHEIPVTITRRDDQTGRMVEEQVIYDNKDVIPSPVADTDISAKTAKRTPSEWGE